LGIDDIVDVYELVASGKSGGRGGTFYADGKGTLCAVHIDVEILEHLAKFMGRKIYPRT
jgi:hypothetical protein